MLAKEACTSGEDVRGADALAWSSMVLAMEPPPTQQRGSDEVGAVEHLCVWHAHHVVGGGARKSELVEDLVGYGGVDID
ncbi:hypothetical protein U9M48_041375 [Paspalum notatum var. saurae]|uniref:Uncharacterized protein n=1 Tax=Paspalum notatum var. saurae TaxID=547442 RepID=A0AAQ3UP29_PASNO